MTNVAAAADPLVLFGELIMIISGLAWRLRGGCDNWYRPRGCKIYSKCENRRRKSIAMSQRGALNVRSVGINGLPRPFTGPLNAMRMLAVDLGAERIGVKKRAVTRQNGAGLSAACPCTVQSLSAVHFNSQSAACSSRSAACGALICPSATFVISQRRDFDGTESCEPGSEPRKWPWRSHNN